MPIGVLGGAFNPPHIGHLVLAQEAAWQLGLERVRLVPTGRPPHKEIADDPGAATRLELARAAAVGNGVLEVDEIEVEAAAGGDRPSFTAETLAAMHGSGDGDLVLLMGADMAASLETWFEPRRVVELARVALASRPGTELGEAEAALERLGASDRADVIEMPLLDVSSTEIRSRVAEGKPVRYLVPDGVLELIEAEGLYAS